MPAVTAFLNAAARREDSTLEEPKARNIEPGPVVGHRKKEQGRSKLLRRFYYVCTRFKPSKDASRVDSCSHSSLFILV